MKTAFSPADLQSSVIAVPPLCRNAAWQVDPAENSRLIRHIEAGGVSTLLYGGNANFYNISTSEYDTVLGLLESASAPDTWIIPSVGPFFGTMSDQASILARHRFPAAMLLPTSFPATPDGVRKAVESFVDRAGIPLVLYLKDENYVTIDVIKGLIASGAIAWIKYAVVRADPADDPLLRALAAAVDPSLIVSGMGEQPAIVHWKKFGLRAFTSGCVCVAPRRSHEMLEALRSGDLKRAEEIRDGFNRLETLRNTHGPIPVLHHAVAGAEIAETGPALPLLSDLDRQRQDEITAAARELRNRHD